MERVIEMLDGCGKKARRFVRFLDAHFIALFSEENVDYFFGNKGGFGWFGNIA